MKERITVEVEKYNKVLLKYSQNWPHQYAMEKPEQGGRWKELVLLTLFPFGSMIRVKMWHSYNNLYESK